MSANFNPVMPCEENEVVKIALTTLKETNLKDDFIPIIKLDKSYTEKGFKYSDSQQHCSLSPYIEERNYILENVTFDDDDELSGYILEPHGESTIQSGKDKRVPEGTYSMVWHTSTKFPKNKYVSKGQNVLINGFSKIHNNNVSQGRAILIHVGNTGADSEGCLLPGSGLTIKAIDNKKKVAGITNSTVKFYD